MLDKLYITPRQWLRILRWTLYAALFLLAMPCSMRGTMRRSISARPSSP